MQDAKCKICRRAGVKLFLKGEKCLSPKCTVLKRPFPPGRVNKKRRRALSEFGKELAEKQKLKNWYNLDERQLGNYVRKILGDRGKIKDPSAALISRLETRLDNAIFRLGFAASHSQARQMVTHGHVLVNEKRISAPSYQLKKGDKIAIHSDSRKMKIFEGLAAALKRHQTPAWLELDAEKLTGEIIGAPTVEEAAPLAEITAIFEYYSR